MRQHIMSPFDAVDGSSTRHASAKDGGAANAPAISEELTIQTTTTIGLNIGKSVFQVHGADAG